MADRKISDLTALTTPATGDLLPIVDISEAAAADKNKSITVGELLRGAPDGTAAAPGIAFESDGGNGMFLGGTDILAFSTGGIQAVTIDASQRLGVGTSSPGGKLEVANGYVVLRNGASSFPDGVSAPLIYGSTGGGSGTFNESGNLVLQSRSDAGSYNICMITGDTPTERMRITSAGNVGIGVTSPGSLNSGANNLVVGSGSGSEGITIYSGSTSSGNIYFADGTAGTDAYVGNIFYSHSDNALAFGTGNGSEKVRIDSSGRVGIGTSSPGALLTLAASVPELRLVDSDNSLYGTITAPGGDIYIDADKSNSAGGSIIRFAVDDSEKARIDSSGRVGIGTTSPGSLLQVGTGALSSNNVAAFLGGSTTFENALTGNAPSITFNNDLDTGFLNPSANTLGFNTGGSRSITIDSSQRVGIGTTSPSSELEVTKSSGDVRLTVQGGTNGDAILALAGAGTGIAKISAWDQLAIGKSSSGAGDISSEYVRIDSSGRLLVGTSSAPTQGTYAQTALLTVQGYVGGSAGRGAINIASGSAASALSSGFDVGTLAFSDSNGGEFARVSCFTDGASGSNDYPGRLVFATTADGASSPTERMRITSSSGTEINIVGSSSSDSGAFRFVNNSQSRQWSISTNSTNFYIADADFSNYAYLAQNPTAWQWGSDARLKENIVDISYGIETIKQLQPRQFNFINNPETVLGFVAQELRPVVPEAVSGVEQEYSNNDTAEERARKSLAVAKETLIPVLVKALQEAIGEIESLKARVAALESA